uniref:Uncharacterized protein n=1 Tax=Cacopsylla melanoneura TaxID=428564 RepID=A0A8D9B1L0_9HEMI
MFTRTAASCPGTNPRMTVVYLSMVTLLKNKTWQQDVGYLQALLMLTKLTMILLDWNQARSTTSVSKQSTKKASQNLWKLITLFWPRILMILPQHQDCQRLWTGMRPWLNSSGKCPYEMVVLLLLDTSLSPNPNSTRLSPKLSKSTVMCVVAACPN